MKTPILGFSYVARSVNAADNRMINLFPEVILEGGKEPSFLQRAPGLLKLCTIGTGPIRGLWQMNGTGYVVSGNGFYSVDNNWVSTSLGTVSGLGPVSIADNGTQIFIATNPNGYIYNAFTNQFQQIVDPDYPGAVNVAYLDGYFVFNEPNSQKVWVTALLDGTSVDPLDFASAEGSPDGLVSLIVDHREAWLFGTTSVEVWYNAGLPDFPLQRIQGAFNEIGCAAPYSVAKLDNGLFWLGSDARGKGIVYRANGYSGERISTHAVEWQIQQYSDISDAIAYTYQQDGHAFYVLIFPTANATWVFDVATKAWHERAGWVNGLFTRHRSNCQMSFGNEIVVGDYINGNLYAFDLDVYSDNNQIQRWLRSWRALPPGQNNFNRTVHHTLQVDAQTGHYLPTNVLTELLVAENLNNLMTEDDNYLAATIVTAITVDPQFMLRWSDDGGHTWSNSHWAGGGPVGSYFTQIFWRRLGMTVKLRDRVYELSGTDPIKIAIMGAELKLSPTNA
jgi:hypothetical protein